jgi:hypothetical protein
MPLPGPSGAGVVRWVRCLTPGALQSGDAPPAAPGMLGTARGRRCQEASTRKGFADLSDNRGRCGTRRPFCRGNRVPMPPSRGLSSEGSGPQVGNSYAEVMGGSSRLECPVVPRRPAPPRNTKCASLGTRSSGVHRGSPDCICSRTSRARSAAGYQTAGIKLGNHSWYSARSRPSRSMETSVPDGTDDPTGQSVGEVTEEWVR